MHFILLLLLLLFPSQHPFDINKEMQKSDELLNQLDLEVNKNINEWSVEQTVSKDGNITTITIDGKQYKSIETKIGESWSNE